MKVFPYQFVVLLLLATGLCHSTIFAQERKSISGRGHDMVGLQPTVDSLYVIIDSLKTQLSLQDSLVNEINEKGRTIDSLQHAIIGHVERTQKSTVVLDSLQNQIAVKDKEILSLRADIGFVDTCMVKLANRWLYERYDKKDVEEAIAYFDRIYSRKLKQDLSIVQTLLRDYEGAYKEFQTILKQAQADLDRTSPFAVEDYKKRYLDRLKTMSYYRKYFKSEWNIRYLNEQIQNSIDRLQKHSEKNTTDFEDMIDGLFLDNDAKSGAFR